MKKFLCYDTEQAARGEINVDSRGMLKPVDSELSDTSTNPAQNKAIKSALDALSEENAELKQDIGDLRGMLKPVDSELSDTSTNPVQNRVVKSALDALSEENAELKEDMSSLEDAIVNGIYILNMPFDQGNLSGTSGAELDSQDFVRTSNFIRAGTYIIHNPLGKKMYGYKFDINQVKQSTPYFWGITKTDVVVTVGENELMRLVVGEAGVLLAPSDCGVYFECVSEFTRINKNIDVMDNSHRKVEAVYYDGICKIPISYEQGSLSGSSGGEISSTSYVRSPYIEEHGTIRIIPNGQTCYIYKYLMDGTYDSNNYGWNITNPYIFEVDSAHKFRIVVKNGNESFTPSECTVEVKSLSLPYLNAKKINSVYAPIYYRVMSRQGEGYGFPDNSEKAIMSAVNDGFKKIRMRNFDYRTIPATNT